MSLAHPMLAQTATDAARFEAQVVGVNTFAMSGPGIGYYPTAQLTPGSTVTVVGPKEGDWYKIEPPQGSFSWIPTTAVEEKPDGTGVVTKDEVRVRLGSCFSNDAHYVFQQTLKTGDVVQILDRGFLKDKDQVSEWFRILPPAGEVRYVHASGLQVPGVAPNRLPGDYEPIKSGPVPNSRPLAPLSARIIPPAKMVYPSDEPRIQTTQTGKPAPLAEIVDDATLTLPERIEQLSTQLDRMRTTVPESWNIPAAKQVVQNLYAAAESDEAKQRVLALNNQLEHLEYLHDRVLRAQRSRELTVARDQELQKQQQRLQRGLAEMRPRFDAEGILERTGVQVQGQPAWKLSDSSGVSTHFVLAPPGLDIERYEGVRVGLLGKIERAEDVRVPILRLEQLIPLGNAMPLHSTASASPGP